MLLVAAGLVLIVARIALGRSNSWLTAMNLGSLALALYVCCFINFPALIADYNVTHSRDMKGSGIALDFGYLVSLGPQATPGDRPLSRSPQARLDLVVHGEAQQSRSHAPRRNARLARLDLAQPATHAISATRGRIDAANDRRLVAPARPPDRPP